MLEPFYWRFSQLYWRFSNFIGENIFLLAKITYLLAKISFYWRTENSELFFPIHPKQKTAKSALTPDSAVFFANLLHSWESKA